MKKIINNIGVLAVAIIAFSSSSTGQTLPEFINTALANNYQIRILKNSENIAENNNSWGNADFLPTVDLSGGISTAFNNTRQQFSDGSVKQGKNAQTTNTSLSLLANWTVFDGFGVYARKDQLAYLQDKGQLNSKYYIDQTVADIVTTYFQLVYEAQQLANYKQALTISNYRLKLEEKRKELGATSLINYSQALVDYQTDSIRYLEQESKIHTYEIEMNRILNVDLTTPLNFSTEPISFLTLPTKDELFSSLIQKNYQLEIELLNAMIAESDLRMEKAARYPQIDIYGGYQLTQSTAEVGFIELNRNLGPVVGLSVSYNLFGGGKTNLQIENSKLELENAELTKNQVQHNLSAEVLKSYDQYTSITQRMALAKSNVNEMNKVYDIAAEQLAKGAINGYDFRQVQLTLVNAQTALLQQELALKLMEINVNRIAGTILTAYL